MSVYQILVTTPQFNKGRVAARKDMLRTFGPVTPNRLVLDVMPSEFAAGYTHEVAEFAQLPEANQQAQLSHWQHNGTEV